MKKQDKLDCQKVKEMITNNSLSISALSESALNMLIEYETECLMECETEYDMAFMDLCYNALEKFQDNHSVLSDEAIEEIGKKAYQEYISCTSKTKAPSAKTTLRCFIVAAVLLAMLTATVSAAWDPFASWLKDRKPEDMKRGEVLENEHGSFSIDPQAQFFTSIEEMEEQLGLHIEIFEHLSASPTLIIHNVHGNKNAIQAQYNIDQEKIIFTTYLENAPYYKDALEQANLQKQTIGNLEWYITKRNEIQTIIAFDDTYVYVITADSLDIILQFMKG